MKDKGFPFELVEYHSLNEALTFAKLVGRTEQQFLAGLRAGLLRARGKPRKGGGFKDVQVSTVSLCEWLGYPVPKTVYDQPQPSGPV